MHNSLSEKFNSSRSKFLLALAVLATTNSALLQDLKAQTPNNGTNPKIEQVDKNDMKIVSDFTKPLGVTIPTKWIAYASNIIQMLDADGIASAQMILSQDLIKIPEADRRAYLLLSLEAIRTAYDKAQHTTAADSEDCLAESITYENELKSVTGRFAQDRQKRSEIFIAQTQQNISQKEKNIAEMKDNITQKEQNIFKNNQEAEAGLLKIYNINPNDPQLKTLATQGKKVFAETGYKYSAKTAELFAKLGIK